MNRQTATFGGVIGAVLVLGFGVVRLRRELEDEGAAFEGDFEKYGKEYAHRVARDQAALTLADYGLSRGNVENYRRALARLGIRT